MKLLVHFSFGVKMNYKTVIEKVHKTFVVRTNNNHLLFELLGKNVYQQKDK